MSAKYTRLGQLEDKFGVPAREYLTSLDFGGNLTTKVGQHVCPLCPTFLGRNFHQILMLQGIL